MCRSYTYLHTHTHSESERDIYRLGVKAGAEDDVPDQELLSRLAFGLQLLVAHHLRGVDQLSDQFL